MKLRSEIALPRWQKSNTAKEEPKRPTPKIESELLIRVNARTDKELPIFKSAMIKNPYTLQSRVNP
jgi:hypothetical protein